MPSPAFFCCCSCGFALLRFRCISLVLLIFILSTEQVVMNDESDKKVPSEQGSSRSESPLPQQQPRPTENDTARRRKRKRELKSKTYMNDEGFMGKR